MESSGNEDRGEEKGWSVLDRPGSPQWDDVLRGGTIPSIPDQTTTTLRQWPIMDLPGPWNTSYNNPFVTEDRKPLIALLADGERDTDLVKDTSLFVTNTINVLVTNKLVSLTKSVSLSPSANGAIRGFHSSVTKGLL